MADGHGDNFECAGFEIKYNFRAGLVPVSVSAIAVVASRSTCVCVCVYNIYIYIYIYICIYTHTSAAPCLASLASFVKASGLSSQDRRSSADFLHVVIYYDMVQHGLIRCTVT